jgi:hypothetical protein
MTVLKSGTGGGGTVDMPTACCEHAQTEFKGTRSTSLYWSSCAKRWAESLEMIGSWMSSSGLSHWNVFSQKQDTNKWIPVLTSCWRTEGQVYQQTTQIANHCKNEMFSVNKTATFMGNSVFLLYEDCCLVGYDAVWSVRTAQTFRRNMLHQSSPWITILFTWWKQQDRLIRHQLYQATRRHEFKDNAQKTSKPSRPLLQIQTCSYARLQNSGKRLTASCLSVRVAYLGWHSADFHEIWYLRILKKKIREN